MSINNLNNSAVLEEPDALEDILDVNGDPSPEAALPPHVATYLGEQLQAYYAHLISEPVPDRLIQFIAQLDRQGNGHNCH